jgi:hypothetical protein
LPANLRDMRAQRWSKSFFMFKRTYETPGAMSTTVQGTISRSTGTLNIGGNLTISGSAATMQCSVTPQDPNNIDISVSGTATLSGRVSVTMTGTFTPGTQFTLLHANGGVSGTFRTQSITKPNTPCFTPLIRYDANNVYLYLQPCT